MKHSESKISQLFEHYKQRLANHIRHLVHPQDIDDIVQDTFIKSYEAELKQNIEFPKTYMLRTARNLALNHIQKHDNKLTDSVEETHLTTVSMSSPSLEQEFESKERFLNFCRATDKLPDQCRKAFILKKVYGLSQKEISTYLNLSESTIEKHIAKGIRRSFEYMKDLESGHGNATTNIKPHKLDRKA